MSQPTAPPSYGVAVADKSYEGGWFNEKLQGSIFVGLDFEMILHYVMIMLCTDSFESSG